MKLRSRRSLPLTSTSHASLVALDNGILRYVGTPQAVQAARLRPTSRAVLGCEARREVEAGFSAGELRVA